MVVTLLCLYGLFCAEVVGGRVNVNAGLVVCLIQGSNHLQHFCRVTACACMCLFEYMSKASSKCVCVCLCVYVRVFVCACVCCVCL